MKISVVTILPELIEGGLAGGVVGKAAELRRYSQAAPDAGAASLKLCQSQT